MEAAIDAGVLEAAIDAGVFEAAIDAGVLEAAIDAGVLEAAIDAGVIDASVYESGVYESSDVEYSGVAGVAGGQYVEGHRGRRGIRAVSGLELDDAYPFGRESSVVHRQSAGDDAVDAPRVIDGGRAGAGERCALTDAGRRRHDHRLGDRNRGPPIVSDQSVRETLKARAGREDTVGGDQIGGRRRVDVGCARLKRAEEVDVVDVRVYVGHRSVGLADRFALACVDLRGRRQGPEHVHSLVLAGYGVDPVAPIGAEKDHPNPRILTKQGLQDAPQIADIGVPNVRWGLGLEVSSKVDVAQRHDDPSNVGVEGKLVQQRRGVGSCRCRRHHELIIDR